MDTVAPRNIDMIKTYMAFVDLKHICEFHWMKRKMILIDLLTPIFLLSAATDFTRGMDHKTPLSGGTQLHSCPSTHDPIGLLGQRSTCCTSHAVLETRGWLSVAYEAAQ